MTIYYEQPVRIELKGRSLFVNDEVHPFTVRTISQINDVLMEKQSATNTPLYFMFRSIVAKEGLRYDITVIPPKKIGKEYNKTYGHYHPIAEKNLTYPEIYQVLDGRAIFVLQKRRSDDSVDVLITYGEKGQVILIPPNWGHVTVNPDLDRVLVMSNLVAENCEGDYTYYKQNRGAAYYITEHGLEQNNNCLIKSTVKMKPEELNAKYGFMCRDLLKEFWEKPENFEFLKKPSLISR